MRMTVIVVAAVLLTPSVFGGVFLPDVSAFSDVDSIVHPFLYLGSGAALTVRVCVDPALSDIDQAEPSIIRAISTWKALLAEVGNLDDEAVPDGMFDFQTAILHELGHCALGLGHPNLGFAISEPSIVEIFLTNSTPGPNEAYEYNAADEEPGSSNDFRGDDVNRMWFNVFDNNPFVGAGPIGGAFYSNQLEDLPRGDSYAANANRFVGASLDPQVLNTEAVMTAVAILGEARRELMADDVTIRRFAQTGADTVSGTKDDYTVKLDYQGRTTSSAACDVIIQTAEQPFTALCEVEGITIGNNHFRLAGDGIITMSPPTVTPWFYPEVFADGFEDGDTSGWSEVVP